MRAVLQTIRILVIIQLIEKACCQSGPNNGDFLRYQQASNDEQIETIPRYSNNIIQRDPSSQSVNSVNGQYHTSDDANKNGEYNSADRGRSRKVYRIKNPFQHSEDSESQDENTESRDSGTGASNQYAAMQYSLPPEEFLQQLRAENHYFQQQQLSTPAPNIGYTVSPQPQYQYSTISPFNYDNSNPQSNQIQLAPKTIHTQTYIPNSNYPYSSPKIFSLDNVQSTPSSINSYLSTPLPNNQFVVTPSNSYASSSSSIFSSSHPNLQHYVSSPLSPIQISSSDYNNRAGPTIGTSNYDNNDLVNKIKIDHYDNSENGIRNSINGQQYQNDYPSSTPSILSSPYSSSIQNSWQNSVNTGANALSKSLQEVSLTKYQNYQKDAKSDSISDNRNSDNHHIGNLPSANNVYMSIAQPDYQSLSDLKIRTRDTELETGHPELYSNGDYGWKLTEQKAQTNHDNKYASSNYPGYTELGFQSDGGPVSQMNFHMDISKPYNYDQAAKSSTENAQSQEFAKAAAKAHESFKQQQQLLGNNYASFSFGTNHQIQNGNVPNSNNDKQNNRYADSSNSNLYSFSNTQGDLITASPYYYVNSNEKSVDLKSKQPFDHAKALKNIVPIDVSNVVSNSNAQMKSLSGFESNNRYNVQSYGKDHADQNLKHHYRPVTNTYYKDKNTIYGFNIKTKPEDFFTLENLKQFNQNDQYQGKPQQTQESNFNQFSFSGPSQSFGYTPQVSEQYQDNIQVPANFHQQSSQRPQNQIPSNIASILKLNDVPYRLSQGSTSEAFRLNNNDYDQANVPTPLPIQINQNLGSHQLDVTTNLLNKLILNNQPGLNVNKPDIDSLSTINGFKVTNPYNVDLSLVAEMLQGKSTLDSTHMLSLKDQYSKPSPLKLDLSQLQLLLRNEHNTANLAPLSDGMSALGSSYLDVYNNGRFPYQGAKYSRSQEEEESIIPIADTSNTHPIGAVMEQDVTASEREENTGSDTTAHSDESIADHLDEGRTKKPSNSVHRTIRDRNRHPNALLSGRHTYHRKYPKAHFGEPYLLLKPPPSHVSRTRDNHVKPETFNRRRRVNKPKGFRILKSEPLYEANSETENDTAMPIVLRPPPPVAESKSDTVDGEQSS